MQDTTIKKQKKIDRLSYLWKFRWS